MFYERDYVKAVKRSFDLLFDEEITTFPIDSFKIAESLGWTVKTYTQLAREIGCTTYDLVNISKDALTKKCKGYYVIAYNDTGDNCPERINFSIMHEIGHIYMNHFKYATSEYLYKNGLNEGLYKKMECEANCFARNVLCPAIVAREIRHKICFDQYICDEQKDSYFNDYIIKQFSLSKPAAKSRIDFYDDDLKNSLFPRSIELKKQCSMFINMSKVGITLGHKSCLDLNINRR